MGFRAPSLQSLHAAYCQHHCQGTAADTRFYSDLSLTGTLADESEDGLINGSKDELIQGTAHAFDSSLIDPLARDSIRNDLNREVIVMCRK